MLFLEYEVFGVALIYRNLDGDYDNSNYLIWEPSKLAFGLTKSSKATIIINGVVRKIFLADLDQKLKGIYWIDDPNVFRKEVCLHEITAILFESSLRKAGSPSGRHLSKEEFQDILDIRITAT